MRNIQMTLDDDLIDRVDSLVKELKTTRSAFAREALREALDRNRIRKLEDRHRRGYEKYPSEQQEASLWEKEQVWGEE
ncbi:MAG: ribbon-helix-helix protein, CopG family [Deltaproteobacteria bacterium]|nr:ribbon-helix-helix protein, CopG family [Deltaproteobacteria bacterium]